MSLLSLPFSVSAYPGTILRSAGGLDGLASWVFCRNATNVDIFKTLLWPSTCHFDSIEVSVMTFGIFDGQNVVENGLFVVN